MCVKRRQAQLSMGVVWNPAPLLFHTRCLSSPKHHSSEFNTSHPKLHFGEKSQPLQFSLHSNKFTGISTWWQGLYRTTYCFLLVIIKLLSRSPYALRPGWKYSGCLTDGLIYATVDVDQRLQSQTEGCLSSKHEAGCYWYVNVQLLITCKPSEIFCFFAFVCCGCLWTFYCPLFRNILSIYVIELFPNSRHIVAPIFQMV